MNTSYELTGIVINKKPLAENDLLLTILSPEQGLVRVVAPSARKYKSQLRGRTELLVVNSFFIVKGKSLDRITQIETIESHPQLSYSIEKLTASQYLAELVLHLALPEQPQVELYTILLEHLNRLVEINRQVNLFPYISQAVFHLLAVSGIAPNVYTCVQSQKNIEPQFNQLRWHIGFSFHGGGVIRTNIPIHYPVNVKINAIELALLQSLASANLTPIEQIIPDHYDRLLIDKSWIRVERLLKSYLEFQLGKVLKSAEMITDLLIAF